MRWRRRLIAEQTQLITDLRQTVRAQAAALIELTDAANELSESARTWRTIALNTADTFTQAMKERDL